MNIHTIQSLKELRQTIILRLSNQTPKKAIYIPYQNTLLQLGEQKGFDFRQAKPRKYRDYRRNVISTSSYICIMAAFVYPASENIRAL